MKLNPITGKQERSKLLSSLHLRATNPTPKSVTRKHHLKHSSLSFLQPTARHPIPISVINLHLASHSFSRFLASAMALAAESVRSVPLDKSIWTKQEQPVDNRRSPMPVKSLERERLTERSVECQVAEREVSVASLMRGQRVRSRCEMEG